MKEFIENLKLRYYSWKNKKYRPMVRIAHYTDEEAENYRSYEYLIDNHMKQKYKLSN